MYQAFMAVARQHGRITDGLLMARYGLRHPDDAVRSLPLAVGLLRRRRLDAGVQKVPDPERWRALFQKKGGE